MPYQYKREPLTPDEANRLASACETHQERFIVWTLLDTGLRVSELAGLARDQIDWQNHRLMIYGKGGIWLPLRIREILYGSVLGRRDARTVLSSTYPHNELMRLCLLRWQSERRSAVLRPRWRVGITFSFNPRFLRVRTSDCQQRKYSLA